MSDDHLPKNDPRSEEVEPRDAAASAIDEDADAPRGIPASAKIAAVLFVLVGAVVALLLRTDVGDAVSYSKLVHEVVSDPDEYRGRQLRVEGDLRQGSIQFREEPCEWRFVIEKEGQQMPVTFPQCVVPDTFRDGFGIQVTVQGHLQDDGGFLANEVIPRCPSKYEMQERLENGEQVPHAGAPATTAL